jgi:hypothetical protein
MRCCLTPVSKVDSKNASKYFCGYAFSLRQLIGRSFYQKGKYFSSDGRFCPCFEIIEGGDCTRLPNDDFDPLEK